LAQAANPHWPLGASGRPLLQRRCGCAAGAPQTSASGLQRVPRCVMIHPAGESPGCPEVDPSPSLIDLSNTCTGARSGPPVIKITPTEHGKLQAWGTSELTVPSSCHLAPSPPGTDVASSRGDDNASEMCEIRSWMTRHSTIFYAEDVENLYLKSQPEERRIKISKEVIQTMSYAGIAILVYAGLLCSFEFEYFVPYDSGFALVLLWSGAMMGASAARFIGLPPLLGMLCAGILLKNLGDPVRGLVEDWAAAIRAFGLMNILMRGGLEMDVGAVRRVGLAVIRLTAMPGITEAFAVAVMAVGLFHMPFFLALSMGFILAAVSPAVVVGGMFDLQSRGYGVAKGIPSLVVAAASFDDVVAISGFSMCIGLAISGGGNMVLEALHGPINIVAGTLVGGICAVILSMTRFWDSHYKRSVVLLLLGVIVTFSSKKLHFAGAGALAALVMAAGASQLWARGFGGGLSLGPDGQSAHDVEADLCRIWRVASEPLLFSVIGSALDFGAIKEATIPKAVALIIGGVVVRCLVAVFATYGAGLSMRDRIFIALAWMPKATVQAALGSVPLDLAKATLNREDDPAKYDAYVEYGTDILTTAVFSILLTAPVGLIVIQKLGPRWLEQGADFAEPNLELRNAASSNAEGEVEKLS